MKPIIRWQRQSISSIKTYHVLCAIVAGLHSYLNKRVLFITCVYLIPNIMCYLADSYNICSNVMFLPVFS